MLTQGATMEHARAMIHSALRDWLEHHIQDHHVQLPAAPERIHSEPLHIIIGAESPQTADSA
jgi:predicted RNase H-like HicB family nuclease